VETNPAKPQKVVFAQRAWAVIEENTMEAGRKETGGILVGCRLSLSKECFLAVVQASGPGKRADQQLYTYAPDVEALQLALDTTYARYKGLGVSVEYIGEWHKHPKGMNRLSSGDVEQGKAILSDPDYKLEFGGIILPIATLGAKKGSKEEKVELYPFYMSRQQLEPSALDMAIWADEELDEVLIKSKIQ